MSAIWRLLQVEAYHFAGRRFSKVAVALLLAGTPLIAWFHAEVRGSGLGDGYRTLHALQVFADGGRAGLTLATYLAVLFAGMSFAREFDHGTIKNILIRPVRRGDVFAAKCLIAVGVLFLFQALALYAALLFAMAVGDLGDVWTADKYIVLTSLDKLTPDAWRAVRVAFPAGLAAVGIALWISNLTESSGWATASALVVMVLLNLAATGTYAPYNFFYFPNYAFDVLGSLSRGSSALYWEESKLSMEVAGLTLPRYVVTPALTALLAVGLAYPIFRFKDVKA